MTVQPGSAIGRELGLLEAAGLISLAGTDPELEYLFRHVLIQDAAYESLLKQERRSLHLQVAEALLALYPDHRDDLVPVLAHHFERAEDRPRAIEFLSRAAQQAGSRFARHEAFDLARRTVALLSDVAEVDPAGRRVRAEMRLVQVEAGFEFTPASDLKVLLEAAIEDASAIPDTELLARAHLFVALGLSLGGAQYHTSPELADALQRTTELAEASGRAELVALALASTAESRYAAGEFGNAIELMERAVPALVETGQLYQASMVAGKLGTAYGHVGRFDESVAWTDRAYELGEESGDPDARLDANLARAIVEGIRGNSTLAIEYATRAASEAERVDNKACAMVAHSVIGEARLSLGDPAEAAIAFEASADLAAFCQFMPVKLEQTALLLQAARAQAGVGHVEFERYERAIELARQFGDRLAEAQLHMQRARDRLTAGQRDGVGDDLTRAARILEGLGATAHLRQVHHLEASLAASAG